MKIFKLFLSIALFGLVTNLQLSAQNTKLAQEAQQAMLRSTQFMVEKVSTNGGYVWSYLPDFTRRWGEMEAYKTMIWLQNPGTSSMGHLFLDAYEATGDEYYYQAAEKAASAIVWGQSPEGGWNYVVDFGGDASLKKWYSTIGQNGWRLEEFQHYYGNSTFDDDVSSEAARFILRMYLEKMDPVWRPCLDKAINFIIESQYPLGGWPQRYPLKYDFVKQGDPDYTAYYTFNDDVIWENVNFLTQCYQVLGQERFLDPIFRGMNFYLISQDSSGSWGQQLDMNMQAAGARTYEPKALLPRCAYGNAMLLLKFYQYTGDKRYIARVPDAINWLERVKLPESQSAGGRYTHSTFVEMGTNKPIYAHRLGSNVKYGRYFVDYSDQKLLGHYGGKSNIQVNRLKEEYKRISALSPEEAMKDSPLKVDNFKGEGTPQHFYKFNQSFQMRPADDKQVQTIISSLDSQGRWLTKGGSKSNPYIGEGQKQELTDQFASTNVGDETDTSPYRDESDQLYITTSGYIRNMNVLIGYIKSVKTAVAPAKK
jgi:hypothetical protein